MSSVVTHRDKHGVLLRYGDVSALHRYHVEQRPQVSDQRRNALVKAERELLTLQIIADHLDLSDIARTRIADALDAIRLGLEFKRRDYGMSTKAEAAA